MAKKKDDGFLGPEPDPKKDREQDNKDNAKIIRNLRAGRKVDDTRGNKED
jgi:hypothetical protein